MNEEKEIKELKFGESYRTKDGCKYTRTINGWIYANYSGTAICFIPDVKPDTKSDVKEEAKADVKSEKTKAKETKTK